MIAFAFLVLIVGCALLGQLIPRFAFRVVRKVRERRKIQRIPSPFLYQIPNGPAEIGFIPADAEERNDFAVFRSVFDSVAYIGRDRLSDDSGNTIPVAILSLVTLAIILIVAGLIVRDVLRVAVALPF